MAKLLTAIILAALVTAPAQAGDWRDGASNIRPGAFIGAKLQLSTGGREHAQPNASLTVAPTQSRVGADGMLRTRIGDGVAFNLSPGTKPRVTLAGVRADVALGLQPGRTANTDKKLGVSSVGWVAIGVGVVAIAGGLYFVHLVREADKNSD
jgi:hypothetical protein